MMSIVLYASAIGCLMYVIVCTIPTLTYTMSVASKLIANPRKEHWQAVKWGFRYWSGTFDYNIEFGTGSGVILVIGYVDLDYAVDFMIESLSRIMCLHWLERLSVGDPLFNQSLFYLLLRQNIWL